MVKSKDINCHWPWVFILTEIYIHTINNKIIEPQLFLLLRSKKTTFFQLFYLPILKIVLVIKKSTAFKQLLE